jgi:hypothetical protein
VRKWACARCMPVPLFDRVAYHLAGTLQEFAVADAVIGAILERIGPLASQIVNTPSSTAAAADSLPLDLAGGNSRQSGCDREIAGIVLVRADRVDFDLAGGDLFVGRADETELAYGKRFASEMQWRTEGAAGDRTPFVEVARAGLRIEGGTGLVFGLFGIILGTPPDASGEGGLDRRQSFPEAGGVFRRDGEGSEAAFEAARTASEPGTSFAGGLQQTRVDDLN